MLEGESIATFGRLSGTTKIRSGDVDLIHRKGLTDYKIWDASNLPTPASTSDIPDVSDMARRSEANTFTANNSFTAGQFSVGSFMVSSSGSFGWNGNVSGGWARECYFYSGSSSSTSPVIAFGGFGDGSDNTVNYAYIRVGNNGYVDASYKFWKNKLYVPSSWELVDSGTDTSVILYNNANAQHIGRGIGVTYVRSGNDDLYHTKGTTNYKILDESNYSQYLPTTSKWTYGFVHEDKTTYDLNTDLLGPDTGKLAYNYTGPSYWTNGPTGMSYGMVVQIWGSGSQSSSPSLMPQLAFDVNHNVAGSTRYMWFRTANNLGYGDSSNWKRVVTADEKPAGYVLDKNSYPALKSIEHGTTLTWLRAPQSGFIPFTAVNIANGGSGSLGTSTWTFKDAYIANVYANKFITSGGSSSQFLKGDGSLDSTAYLPLTGGTLSGALVVSPIRSDGFIVNNADTSGVDVIQTFRMKGANKFLLGWSESGGGPFMQRSDNNRCMVLMSDGLYTGSSLRYVARVATMTDLGSYATQSWVTSQGYLTSHQAIYALTFAAGAFAAKTFTPTSSAVTVNVPTKTSHLTNDSGFLTSVPSTYATQTWVTSQGYLTSITKSMVTTALGYTPPTTNTTYSQATSSTLGLVKIGATGLASKNYAVQLNSSGQMYVAVPWTDTNTTYNAATSSTYGLVKIGATGLASKNYAVQLNSSGQMYVAVPWTDTDTNTHYTTRLYAGASGTAANSATTSPYIKVTDDNTYRNQIRLLGGGATSVSSDASGNITITSTNTTYGLATASSNGLMSSSQYTKLSNCIETVSATNMVTSVQVVDTIPATSSQVTGRLYLKFA